MNFTVILERKELVTYEFEDDQFEASDADEWEPSLLCGEILVDDKEIGQITIYELYNDKITIDKEYRNQGIGSAIIKNLLKMINYQFGEGSTIFLFASAYETAEQYGFESDEYKKETNCLIQFYKKLGFRIVKDNVMVYNETNA